MFGKIVCPDRSWTLLNAWDLMNCDRLSRKEVKTTDDYALLVIFFPLSFLEFISFLIKFGQIFPRDCLGYFCTPFCCFCLWLTQWRDGPPVCLCASRPHKIQLLLQITARGLKKKEANNREAFFRMSNAPVLSSTYIWSNANTSSIKYT